MINIEDILRSLIERISPTDTSKMLNPSPSDSVASSPTIAPQESIGVARKMVEEKKSTKTSGGDIERKIRGAFKEYAKIYNQGESVPAEKYIPQFVEAAKKYPFFRDNPFLLPQISILETSGGKNITRPNNLLNWGINYPGNNEAFSRMSVPRVLDIAIGGLGKRSPYYKQFRTGVPLSNEEINNFAKVYEPQNPSYGENLRKGMRFFEER